MSKQIIRLFLLCIVFLFQKGNLPAQNSFVKEIIGLDDIDFSLFSFDYNDDSGNLSTALLGANSVFFTKLSPQGEVIETFKVSPEVYLDPLFLQYQQEGNYHVVGVNASLDEELTEEIFIIFMVNFATGEKWVKRTACAPFSIGLFTILNSDKVLVKNYDDCEFATNTSLGLALLDLQTGDEIWSYFYRPTFASTSNYAFLPLQIVSFPNGDILVLARINLTGSSDYQIYLIKVSIDGVIKKSVVLDSYPEEIRPTDINVNEDGNVYLSGRVFSPDKGYDEGFIAKLDNHLNLQWTKKLSAEAFFSHSLNTKSLSDGNQMFVYTTQGDLPVITGAISKDGELLWHKGYSFYNPIIRITQDNSIIFISKKKYHQDGSWEWAPIIAKTDPNGDIEGCEQFDACLELSDMNLNFTEVSWNRFDGPSIPGFDLGIEAATGFSTASYCGTPEPPRPDFTFPDTLCQYSCAAPSDLRNRLANHIEWTLTGPGIDTMFVDSTFNWCFDTAGTYTIEQEVWLLGCSEFFSHTLEVLPDDLKVSLGEDRTVCETAPYQLLPEGSRPLQTFLWGDSSEEAALTVLQAGTYTLEASDGYCSGGDTVSIAFIEDFIDEEPLTLPPDERLCPTLLPYILRPQSPYRSLFTLNGTKTDSVFSLTKTGIYTVGVEIEGCLFSKVFEIEEGECHTPIYLPNSFSPNDDGVNDLYFPQGQDYEGRGLQVFDRWGDLIFETKQPPFKWDGSAGGRPANIGVYIVVFRYLNLLNLTEEVVSQGVLLVR